MGTFFQVIFRDTWGKKETTDLRLSKRKSLEPNGYHPASRLGKIKKWRQETATDDQCTHIHTPSFASLHLTPILGLIPPLAPPLPHLLVKAKSFIHWQNHKPGTLSYSRPMTFGCHPSSRRTHTSLARGYSRKWRPPRKWQQRPWPERKGTQKSALELSMQKYFEWGQQQATPEAEQP